MSVLTTLASSRINFQAVKVSLGLRSSSVRSSRTFTNSLFRPPCLLSSPWCLTSVSFSSSSSASSGGTTVQLNLHDPSAASPEATAEVSHISPDSSHPTLSNIPSNAASEGPSRDANAHHNVKRGTTVGLDADGRSLTFGRDAFEAKTSLDLIKTAVIFSICKIKPLIKQSNAIMDISRKALGDTTTDWLLRKTFFGHFCGGERLQELQATIRSLQKQGVGSILDYVAEKDAPDSSSSSTAVGVKDDMEFNLRSSMEALTACSIQPQGFAAVKLTSLVPTPLLVCGTELIWEAHDLFAEFSQIKDPEGLAHVLPTRLIKAEISRDTFTSQAQELLQMNLAEAENIYQELVLFNEGKIKGNGGAVTYFQWMDFFTPERLGRGNLLGFLRPSSRTKALSDEDAKSWMAGSDRMRRLVEHAAQFDNVSVLIDAEQTYMQPAIDAFTIQAMQFANKNRAVVYNTYQAYLRSAKGRLDANIQQAQMLGYKLGVKLVRGAYMVQERALACEKGYPDPINTDLESTHYMYNSCVRLLLDNMKDVDLMMGTHNEKSIQVAVDLLRQQGHDPGTAPVSFGQLLGMSDHVTLKLGQIGLKAYKYVPYGPVKEALPYLLRRAQENSDMLGSSTTETKLVLHELMHRVKTKCGMA